MSERRPVTSASTSSGHAPAAPREQGVASAAKGLATVALLKANFDAGKDHLEMFQPFVRDCVPHLERDDFAVDELRAAVLERHSLAIPIDTLRTLLARLGRERKPLVKREAGRYFRLRPDSGVPDLAQARAAVESRQQVVAQALLDFAESKGLHLRSAEDALALILQFLGRYHVSMALAVPLDLSAIEPEPDEAGGQRRSMVVVASFLKQVVERDDVLTATLHQMLEGFVLQNALFLKDISIAARRFDNLEVFLDTALLFATLGLTGEAAQVAMDEALALLRETGARLAAFDVTLKEMRRILSVYEEHLATSEGRLTLHPTEVTMFVLNKRYTPSDIREIGALLERRLLDRAINVRQVPTHRPEFTLDEEALTRSLASQQPRYGFRKRNGSDPRVRHDVDCIAGVLTLRAGRSAASLDHSRAVFATASWLTLKNTLEWFEKQGSADVPPLIHHLTLSNIAWLKKPASAVKLQLHELVAMCAAVLVPSRRLWEGFVAHLRRLQAAGDLTSDELAAIVASNMTKNLLVEQERDDGDYDAGSLSQVVERVKASYQEEARHAVAGAESRAREKEDEVLRIRSRVENSASWLARTICRTVAWIAVPALILGMVLSIPGVTTESAAWKWLPIILFSVLSLGSVLWGFNLKGWRIAVEQRLAAWIRKRMLGGDPG
jgi:hypothetical protein